MNGTARRTGGSGGSGWSWKTTHTVLAIVGAIFLAGVAWGAHQMKLSTHDKDIDELKADAKDVPARLERIESDVSFIREGMQEIKSEIKRRPWWATALKGDQSDDDERNQ